jgi:hypothetical protein
MVTVDYVFIAVVVVAALIGMMLGFNKVLKLLTGGIFGIIISVVVCVMVGGSLQNLTVSQNLINSVDAAAVNAWAFLAYLKPGYVVFYLVLFALVQAARMIVVRIIRNVARSNSAIVRVFDKSLGLALSGAFVVAVSLLFFAGIKLLGDTSFGQDVVSKIGGGWLKTIYDNNPINFANIKG